MAPAGPTFRADERSFKRVLTRREWAEAASLLRLRQEGWRTRVQVASKRGSGWLSQRLMAGLFQVSVPTINEHLGNISDEGEVEPGATIRRFRMIRVEGRREVLASSITTTSM